MDKINFEDLANALIDEIIERDGVNWMLRWLLNYGMNEKQLIWLGFEREDIEKVKGYMRNESCN